ncbi:hypothetical protein I4U23_009255 [Adineta vaga]|nr:hypothetical protein I4U23_009255 [Adineta vaga]
MKAPRIVNRGRIAPSSPKPVIDSGRTSFSSASAVSTIDDIDPESETHVPEKAIQKLEQSIKASSIKKKVILGVVICAVFALLFAIIFGVTYSLTRDKS